MYDIRPNKSRVYFLAHATVETLSSFSNYLTVQYINVNYKFFEDEILNSKYFSIYSTWIWYLISTHFIRSSIMVIHNMRQLKL